MIGSVLACCVFGSLMCAVQVLHSARNNFFWNRINSPWLLRKAGFLLLREMTRDGSLCRYWVSRAKNRPISTWTSSWFLVDMKTDCLVIVKMCSKFHLGISASRVFVRLLGVVYRLHGRHSTLHGILRRQEQCQPCGFRCVFSVRSGSSGMLRFR